MMRLLVVQLAVATGVVLVGASGARTQSSSDGPIWTARAALSGVTTSGNTSTQSLGFKGHLGYQDGRNKWSLEVGGLRKRDSQEMFFAVGSPDDFDVVKLKNPQTTAENYYAETGIERTVNRRLLLTANGGWQRDLFSGIEHLVSGRAGVGYAFWSKENRGEAKGKIEATINNQKDTVPSPATDTTFVGLRAGYAFFVNLGQGQQNTFRSQLDLDENLQETADLRVGWQNSLTVALSNRFALQVGAEQKLRKRPALREVDLYPPGGDPSRGTPVDAVVTPFKKLDSAFTVALVVNWGPKSARETLPE
jgi:hypothetical protein